MQEMKKQIACYKTELKGIQQTDKQMIVENYSKVVNEYNQLYDHYKGVKQINKKLRNEICQSNEREKTFLKLLKKTSEYGSQAAKLEMEYDRLKQEDLRVNGGVSLDNLIVDTNDRRQRHPEYIDKGRGVKIPKLDFSSIYIQREVQPTVTAMADNGPQDNNEDQSMTSQEHSSNNSGIEEEIAIVKGAILKKHEQKAAPKQ